MQVFKSETNVHNPRGITMYQLFINVEVLCYCKLYEIVKESHLQFVFCSLLSNILLWCLPAFR